MDYLFRAFRRVTQVIYPKDLGLMIIISGIEPGAKVLEAGVGTGFLTATLARIVGDSGHVYAYELREENIERARRNLELEGLLNRVTLKKGDVRKDVSEKGLDAAFLDIPDPWNALGILKKTLKPSSPAVFFVPTLNQVVKFLKAVNNEKCLIDIHIYESILREYQPIPEALRPYTIMIGHTGYVIYGRVVID
jgi:tRNA (adenine57-N1/adenine58-N1)-methyltransferase